MVDEIFCFSDSVYSYILMFDVKFGNSTITASPKMDDLVEHVMAYLELLNGDPLAVSETSINQDVEMLSISDKSASKKKAEDTTAGSALGNEPSPSDEDDDDRKKALRIAKTGKALSIP